VINPLIEIRKNGQVAYRGKLTAEMARNTAKHNCRRCHGRGVLHMDDASITETDVACSCVWNKMERQE
jgi:hypothetical protein